MGVVVYTVKQFILVQQCWKKFFVGGLSTVPKETTINTATGHVALLVNGATINFSWLDDL